MNIKINAEKLSKKENTKYYGFGMVSGNNSSRLLLDYKRECPEKYWEILHLIFDKDKIGINHLKIEMGSDVNSTSGTEPATKRTEKEECNVFRGAGFILAADAKKIRPDLTLDMLWWSEPKWVSDSKDIFAARYKWYKENLEAAYKNFELKFDYLSANRNERGIEQDWIIYFSKALKSEKNCSYDYSSIKVVAADEENSWWISENMKNNPQLKDAVDIIGSHYTSESTEATFELFEKDGKTVWFTEGSPPMSFDKEIYRFGENVISQTNGFIDTANRIIAMYPRGKMTMYQFQPVVSAYYDGVCFCNKQLITANTPWNGYFEKESGYYMCLHFSKFIQKGWYYLDEACYNDGINKNHCVFDTKYSFITAISDDEKDFSTVITNQTNEDLEYDFEIEKLMKNHKKVNMWISTCPEKSDYENWKTNYFVKNEILIEKGKFSAKIPKNSLVTITTIEDNKIDFDIKNELADLYQNENTIMALPYKDNFLPDCYEKIILPNPKFTTDMGGAFEIEQIDGKNVLKQKITPQTKATDWGYTPNPVTNFGDDRWFNYSVEIKAKLNPSKNQKENYVGVGLRYFLADRATSGWWLKITEDKTWHLLENDFCHLEGKFETENIYDWQTLKIFAQDNQIVALINEKEVANHQCKKSEMKTGAGRSSIYSSFNENEFCNLKIEPLENPYITRYNNTNKCFSYNENWEHITMSSFKHLKRTCSKAQKGGIASIDFSGKGFNLCGKVEEKCKIKITLDNQLIEENYLIEKNDFRQIIISKLNLENKNHTLVLECLEGDLALDFIEVN